MYLAILMAISLFFSIALYQISTAELRRGLNRPVPGMDRRGIDSIFDELRSQIMADRQAQFDESCQRLINSLIIVNLLILCGGGFLCYFLARRTLRPIEESHAALERFTADAAHELRTPLAVMQSENEVALMDSKLSLKEAKLQLNSNLEEVARLTQLTEGLLRLSRHDGRELHREPVAVNEIIKQAVDRMQKQAVEKQVTIQSKVTGDKAEVLGDQASLVEAVVVLLDNAIKYSPVASKIEVTSKSSSKLAEIVVKDFGVGIAEADLPHIFERFYRADSSRTQDAQHGYGLGLALAKSIIESHDGTICAKSQPKKGSEFIIKLTKIQ